MNKNKKSLLLICGIGVGLVTASNPMPPVVHAAHALKSPCPAGPSGTITNAGVTVTVSAPKRDTAGPGAPIKPGYAFQVVRVTIRDRGHFSYQYNALDFVLLDAGAHAYPENGFADDNLSQRIDMGTLHPGATVTGQLAFLVPSRLTPAAISWQPSGLGLNQRGGDKVDTNPRNVLLPGYKGSAGPCPAGPTGAMSVAGITVTVGPARSDGHSSELPAGEVFQAVHVVMRNRGKSVYAYNPNDFIALDAGAREYPQVTAYDANLAQPIDMGHLRPGTTVSGDLAFEMPAGVKPVALRWIPTSLALQNSGLDADNGIIRLPR